MYFTAKTSFNPSSDTKIVDVKPSKGFLRIFNFLSSFAKNSQEVHQTYTAISILQQLNIVCRRMGITNIVKLSKDQIDFYYDSIGLKNDLKDALDNFEFNVDRIDSSLFKTLDLVLEHDDEHIKYFIDIRISRVHQVGEYPIEIIFNGILKKYENDRGDQLKEKLNAEIFCSQENYESYSNQSLDHFEKFVSKLHHEFQKVIHCKDNKSTFLKKIIKPKLKANPSYFISRDRKAEPILHGFYGISDSLFYAYIWSELCYKNNIELKETIIVDEEGKEILNITKSKIKSNKSDVMNPNIQVNSSLNVSSSGHVDSTPFYDSAIDSSSTSGNTSDSGSSCGSSCGSGCGGGCGGG